MADQTTEPLVETPARHVLRPNPITVLLSYIGEIVILLGQAIREIFQGHIDGRELLLQMATIGANSIPIAILTTFATGAVLALYFAPFLKQYGEEGLVGMIVSLAVSR